MTQGRRKASAAVERKPTRRVVLEKVRVVLVPDGDQQQVQKALAGLDVPDPCEAWIERGEFDGDRPKDAIEQHVKPGTPEQRVGEFRAVPLSNWKGGRRYKLPEQVPLIGESID